MVKERKIDDIKSEEIMQKKLRIKKKMELLLIDEYQPIIKHKLFPYKSMEFYLTKCILTT